MTKKTAQQKKKDAKKARAAVGAQLQAMESATKAVAGTKGSTAASDAAAAQPVVVEEAALGEIGERFDAHAREKFGIQAPSAAADEVADDVQNADDVVDDAAAAAAAETEAAASRAQLRKQLRMTVEELKLVAPDPNKVEIHDANAPDPVFYVRLKAHAHSIPVPRHWMQRSLFLSHQIDREPSDDIVPSFIEKTGVSAMRPDAARNVNPKALAVPYLAGHPKLPVTDFGDVFYEGKDMRARFRRFRPGVMSDRLKQALGMTKNAPPPWLYGMQKLGKLPPSYPTVKVPGLNAPLPSGARWGLSKGEWGQPARAADNSLIFPSVLREIDDDTIDASGMSKDQLWGAVRRPAIELRIGARKAPPPPPKTAQPEQPQPQPSFVPQAQHMPQFRQYAPTQNTFAVEMQRVHAGYDTPGYMPTSQVFVPGGSAPQGQQQQAHGGAPGYGGYAPQHAGLPPNQAGAPPGFGNVPQYGVPLPEPPRNSPPPPGASALDKL